MKSLESVLLPVVPLRELVAFPHTLIPLFIVRAPSLTALNTAVEKDKRIFLVAQKAFEVEEPGVDDLYTYGTIGEIMQVMTLPDGSAKALVEGRRVARAESYLEREEFLSVLAVPEPDPEPSDRKGRLAALVRALMSQFERYVALSQKVPDDVFLTVRTMEEPERIVNAIANYSQIKIHDKQQVLEERELGKKFSVLIRLLSHENELLELEGKILDQVKSQIGKSQKEYFLNEQIRAIERELGVTGEGEADSDLEELSELIEQAGMSEEAYEKAQKELVRLSRMQPMSPESTVSRTYIEWLVETPWKKESKDQLDIDRAQTILDEDHYGLDKVKERVVEHLAVLALKKEMRGPILCLVGPPGVGKSSLGRSVARALDRKFIRISLGGVRDEAEVRGHRRTYIGSMPGKIIQGMKKAGTMNPVLLLDEIDKMSQDFRGDPASALLEVLDPEQNKSFNDHYLEVDYDLSKVLFVTTANSLEGCPPPLIDRMEVLRIPGYTEDEKRHIATGFLVPKQIEANGLNPNRITFTDEAIKTIIVNYTREAGVRILEQQIASVCRKIARDIVQKKRKSMRVSVTPRRVRTALGPIRYKDMEVTRGGEVGVVTGLAWTQAGGEILPIETIVMSGKGEIELTGQLGDVMKESAKAALSYIRAHCDEFGVDPVFKTKNDIHLHVPEGAIPKDGPSAGVGMATSLVSALSGRPVRQDIAMTGEITLRGKVLKIGGLKEKSLAAHRVGIRTILIPHDNVGDLEEIAKEIRDDLEFVPVKTLSQVLKLALLPIPAPKAKKTPRAPKRKSATRRTSKRTSASARR